MSDHPLPPDAPDSPPTGDTTKSNVSRRSFLKAGTASVVAGTLGGAGLAASVFVPEAFGKDKDPLHGTGDLALVNGKFIDGRGEVATAITIRDGRIAEVGDPSAMSPTPRYYNLRGKVVIPGFINGHIHHSRTGTNAGYEARDVETAFSVAEVQEALARRAATVPAGQWINCHLGWHYVQLAENRIPTKAELDEAAPDHKVYISGRAGWVEQFFSATNTAGQAFFEGLGFTVDNATGKILLNPGGTAATPEQAFNAIRDLETYEDRMRQTYDNNQWVLSLGMTGVIDPSGNPNLQNYPAFDLWRQNKLYVRHRLMHTAGSPEQVNARASQMVRGIGDDMMRHIGFGEQIGSLNTTAWAIAENRWKLQQHTDFYEQVEDRLNLFEQIAAQHPIENLRWQLIHSFQWTEAQTQRAKALGVGVDLENERYLDRIMRGGGPFWRLLVDAGLDIGMGVDGSNFAPNNPWLVIYYATTGVNVMGELNNPGQQITRLEALRLFTAGSAHQAFDQDRLGSFDVGKLADLVVLSDDFRTVTDANLRKIRSVLTFVGGKLVHEGMEPQYAPIGTEFHRTEP